MWGEGCLPLQKPHAGVLCRYFVFTRHLPPHGDLERPEPALNAVRLWGHVGPHSHEPHVQMFSGRLWLVATLLDGGRCGTCPVLLDRTGLY